MVAMATSNEVTTENIVGSNKSSKLVQETRAFLRERFLRAISGVAEKQCEFQMYENTNVSGQLGGCDMNVMHFYVTQLKTPMGTISNAILRTNDIIAVHIKDINASNASNE